MKRLRPKARFKELIKPDQYVVTSAALSDRLRILRDSRGGMSAKLANGYQITVREIDPRYVVRDTVTGLLTRESVQDIKRVVSRAFKKVLGRDAEFMFIIEQQDKAGGLTAPHIHALALHPFMSNVIPKLRPKFYKIAGTDDPKTVHFQLLTRIGSHPMEYSPAETHFRGAASYAVKNDFSEAYRSKALMVHVHAFFERYKERFR
ncbi:hypothetical protein ACFO5X_20890 [Seohaeicola nanhaiensis]|uniref:HIT domain-containing protein n=2 Tax=Seohaeicola nanhaiensis TaxID=1387282 RepID=A0ABV9KM07_9RHOB